MQKQIKNNIPLPVGVDIGAKTSSIVTPFGQYICPTVITEGKSSFESLDFSKDSEVTEAFINGDWFTVGEGFIGEIPFKTFGTERIKSPIRAAMLHHLLRNVGLEGKNICLTSSIPIGLYQNTVLQSAAKDSIAFPVKIQGYQPCHIYPKANLLQPEGVASIRSLVFDSYLNTNMIIESNMLIALVDVGGYTTDVSVIRIKGGRIDYDKNYLVSLDGFGMLAAIEQFNVAIEKKLKENYPNITISAEKVSTAFETGKLRVQGEQIDLSDEKNMAIQTLAKKIHRKVTGFLPTDCDLYAFSGGGAITLEPFICGQKETPKWFENYLLVPDAILACAKGNYFNSLISCVALARKLTKNPLLSVEQFIECYE